MQIRVAGATFFQLPIELLKQPIKISQKIDIIGAGRFLDRFSGGGSQMRSFGIITGRLATIAIVIVAAGSSQVSAQTIRSQAVVDLTFDEQSGPAQDVATAGTTKDNGTLVNDPHRIASPFPGQNGKQALVLEAGAAQNVQIADSADVDRPDAVTVSLFFANLHGGGDGAFHGIFAKRIDANPTITNYGINYVVNSDTFQLYLNDTTGYKSAIFGVQNTIGTRRPVFLTAVYQVGDAPAPDADEDKDDVLLRLYVNGKAIAPKSAVGGFAAGEEVWLTDIKVATLVNDAPLTIGSSMPGLEYTNSVVDEFLLFAKGLSPSEVATLYGEVAGAAATATIEAVVAPSAPEVRDVVLRGLQTGQTNVVTILGRGLLPAPQLLLPVSGAQQTLRPGATAEKIEFDVIVPATVAPGHYPLRVQTPAGVSNAATVAVDSLPQVPYVAGAAANPTPLPVAVTGRLSGQDQHRVYFAGKKGQRIVVDLECKRLGSAMDPVLELRNERGAPLNIAWGRPQYRGDTRIEAIIMADGIYSIDLHDLTYKAPGENAYRIKIGELKLVDTTFPAAVPAGAAQTVAVIGPGMDPATAIAVDMADALPGIPQSVTLPSTLGTVGPAPTVVVSEAVEILEATQPAGQLQTVDARFSSRTHVPVIVNGRVSQPGETDRYLLAVTPGMTLNLSAESFGIRSPLEARIIVLSPETGDILAASEERPSLDFAVPAGMASVEVAVRDLNRRGGSDYLYRLRLIPAGQPNFSLSFDIERVLVPQGGSAVIRVDVNRAGYGGPIALQLVGAPDLIMTPAEIPADATKAFIQITSSRSDAAKELSVRRVRLLGQSAGLEPPLRRVAQGPFDSSLSLVPTQRTELTVAESPSAGPRIELGTLPAALYKGTDLALPVTVRFTDAQLAGRPVRLTLLTTEAGRTRVDPTDPTQQRRLPFALIRSLPEQTLPSADSAGTLKLLVPLDVAEPQVDCIVRAEVVSQSFSDQVLASAYSQPFRLNVQPAVKLQPAANSLMLTSKGETKLTGTVQRTAGFTQPVELALVNLPAGYSAPKISIAPDQQQFEVVVTAPEVAAAADLPNVALRVTTPAGKPLQADVPIATKVAPAQ